MADWITPATTLLAALIGGIGGAVAGFVSAKKSESFRYRQWIVDERIKLYGSLLSSYREVSEWNTTYGTLLYGDREHPGSVPQGEIEDALESFVEACRETLAEVDDNWLILDQEVAWKVHIYIGHVESIVSCLHDYPEPSEDVPYDERAYVRPIIMFWLDKGEDELVEAMRKSLTSTELRILKPGVKWEASIRATRAFERLEHAFFNPAAFAKSKFGRMLRDYKYRNILPRTRKRDIPD